MKRPSSSLLITGVVLSGLAAAVPRAATAKPITATYSCKGKPLKVLFYPNKALVIPRGGKTITLPQGLAADGFLYSKGKYSLRGRGNTATWTTGRGQLVDCTARTDRQRPL